MDEFCNAYAISASDQAKIIKLEVELGDRRCEQLSQDVWKGDGGFSKLGWDRFKEKHARFCEDVMDGKFGPFADL